jgi:hypothetical protein
MTKTPESETVEPIETKAEVEAIVEPKKNQGKQLCMLILPAKIELLLCLSLGHLWFMYLFTYCIVGYLSSCIYLPRFEYMFLVTRVVGLIT